MDEKVQFRNACIKLVLISLCALLYCLGGAEFGWGKWLRRIVMPLVMGGSIFWFSRDWKSLLIMPITGIGLCLGYGSDIVWIKVIKRIYCGLVLGVGSSTSDWLNKRFIWATLQTSLVTLAMVILGVFNPLPDARLEELAIGFSIAFLPILNAHPKK